MVHITDRITEASVCRGSPEVLRRGRGALPTSGDEAARYGAPGIRWLKGSRGLGDVSGIGVLPPRVAQGQDDGKNRQQQKQKQILRLRQRMTSSRKDDKVGVVDAT